jgi:hypothetical protein
MFEILSYKPFDIMGLHVNFRDFISLLLKRIEPAGLSFALMEVDNFDVSNFPVLIIKVTMAKPII